MTPSAMSDASTVAASTSSSTSPTQVPPTEERPSGGMRRNESAAAQLQYVGTFQWQEPATQAPLVRKNKSSTALSELGRREQSLPASHADRPKVIEAVVHELLQQMGHSTSGSEQAEELAKAMKSYIETIVKQLDLPNSCIIAMLVYVERAVSHERFELTPLNWQPCLLAAFVVSAKTSFDEPVWNEDFVRRCSSSRPLPRHYTAASARHWFGPGPTRCPSSRAGEGAAHFERARHPDFALGGVLFDTHRVQHDCGPERVRRPLLPTTAALPGAARRARSVFHVPHVASTVHAGQWAAHK